MRRNNKIVFLTLAAAISFASCKKEFLELNPPTSVVTNQALGTEADLQIALRGSYAGLRSTNLYGRTIPMINDIMADNAYQHATNGNRYTLYNNYSFNVTDGDAGGIWASGYNVILRVNNIINAPLASSENVDQYKGEAYAIRALAYFTLVREFARPYTDDPNGLGVPIVTVYDPFLKPARSSVSDVYTLILDDLNKAFTLMTKFTNSSQFSKYAAKALEAKVLLHMDRKAEAKTAALDVINNGPFTPIDAASYVGYWENPAIRTDHVETIFEVSSDAVGNNAFDAISYLYSQGGNYGDYVMPQDFYDLFEATDVRKGLYPITPRPKPSGDPVIAIEKYPAINGDRSDTKVLRLSEMYLIAAEGSTDEAEARTYLNFITSRRGASEITSTGAQLFEDIITERRKELAYEGDRYQDMQRLKRTIERPEEYPSGVRSVEYSNYRRILPIPQVEVDANPNIRPQQNPQF